MTVRSARTLEARRAISDAAGRWRVVFPDTSHAYEVAVRRIGNRPARVRVERRGGSIPLASVRMEAQALVLDAVTATAGLRTGCTSSSAGWTAASTCRMVIRQGRFTFAQLRRLRDRTNDDILRIPGVLFTDVDELSNRFVVGIDAAQAASVQAAVRQVAASRAGGDLDALSFEMRTLCLERTCQEPRPIVIPSPDPSVQPNTGPNDMRAVMDTLPGGAQVMSQRNHGEGTLGFVLYYCAQADVTEMYAEQCRDWYVVTSHQTYTRAQVDADPFYHPNTYYGSPQVAVEAIDTRWHTYPFPIDVDGNPGLGSTCQPYEGYRSLVCRRSDMALLRPTGSVKPKRGWLLRPRKRYMDRAPWPDQFAVDPNDPYMRISGEGIANVGYTVDKLGRIADHGLLRSYSPSTCRERNRETGKSTHLPKSMSV